jgi:hypothetical protein
MKETGILMSGPMVRATLDDLKNQTRRPMNPQPPDWINEFGYTMFTPPGYISGRGFWKGVPGDEGPAEKFFKCPFGMPGDRLWVRETWRVNAYMGVGPNHKVNIGYRAGGIPKLFKRPLPENELFEKIPDTHRSMEAWKPSIHMPRWASRLTLEIVKIRVERIQDISDADICAELGLLTEFPGPGPEPYKRDLRSSFSFLWDSIYAKRGFGWDTNHWVWVIEFKKITG